MLNQKFEPQKNQNAFTAFALRLAVAGYLAVLGYRIITNQKTSMLPVTAHILGGGMILAAVLFCLYIWKRWKADSQSETENKTQQTQNQNGKGADR